MSFEKPERLLTKEEWDILAQAAEDKAGDFNVIAGRIASLNKDMRVASFYANKANKIMKVLINLESEYYKAHPDEDPDRGENVQKN